MEIVVVNSGCLYPLRGFRKEISYHRRTRCVAKNTGMTWRRAHKVWLSGSKIIVNSMKLK
jgi:hypothetical protein